MEWTKSFNIQDYTRQDTENFKSQGFVSSKLKK